MRVYVGSQETVSAFDLDEPTYGFDAQAPEDFRDLFLGEDGESGEQRAARETAARDVLAELIEQSDNDECAMLNALYAAQLLSVVLLMRRRDAQPNSSERQAA